MSRGKMGFIAGLTLCMLGVLLSGSPLDAQLTTSDPAAGEDNLAPSPVADVAATADLALQTITVTWSLSEDDFIRQAAASGAFTSGGVFINVNDVTGYNIWRTPANGDPELVETVATGATEYVDTELLTAGVLYTYGVAAIDGAGNESALVEAAPVSVGPPPTTVPRFPNRIHPALRVTSQYTGSALPTLAQARAIVCRSMVNVGLFPSMDACGRRIVVTRVAFGSLIIDFHILPDPDDPNADDPNAIASDYEAELEADAALLNAAAAEEGVDGIGAVTDADGYAVTDIDLGTVSADGSASETISIDNTSTDPDAILSAFAEVSGLGFAVDPGNATAPAGGTLSMTVSFDAATAGNINGAHVGTLLLRTNDPDNMETEITVTATVTGGVDAQEISLSAASINFRQALIGDTATRTLVITNAGELDLIGEISIDGDAEIAMMGGAFTIAAGGTAEYDVTFSPVAEASYRATITITSNDADEGTIEIPVVGQGVTEISVLLPGDFDASGKVDFTDFFAFADKFGTTPASPDWDPQFDLVEDANNRVDFQDFFFFADNFGRELTD